MIKGYLRESLMVTDHLAKFGGHRHRDRGDMFLVVEEPNCTCSRLIPPVLFIFKGHGLKVHDISC